MADITIRCPKCGWQPDGGAYWVCNCNHVWNTFDTQGVCPACHYRWRETQCPGPGYPGGCGVTSLHDDWYVIPVDLEKELKIEWKDNLAR